MNETHGDCVVGVDAYDFAVAGHAKLVQAVIVTPFDDRAERHQEGEARHQEQPNQRTPKASVPTIVDGRQQIVKHSYQIVASVPGRSEPPRPLVVGSSLASLVDGEEGPTWRAGARLIGSACSAAATARSQAHSRMTMPAATQHTMVRTANDPAIRSPLAGAWIVSMRPIAMPMPQARAVTAGAHGDRRRSPTDATAINTVPVPASSITHGGVRGTRRLT